MKKVRKIKVLFLLCGVLAISSESIASDNLSQIQSVNKIQLVGIN